MTSLPVTKTSLALVVGLTVASGVVTGAWNSRWGAPASLIAASQRFDKFPDEVGEWRLEKAEPFDPQVAEILECAGSTKRIYRHRQTGKFVQVALQVGPAGPTSVHTPDVCLSSQDFEQIRSPERIQILTAAQGGGSLWKADYRARTLDGGASHYVYGWSSGEGWVAADRPRFEFIGHRVLYKIQLASPFTEGDDDGEEVYRDFLEKLLPRLASEVLKPSAT
jgi:hypothetical protein